MARKKLQRIQAASQLANVVDSSEVAALIDSKKVVVELGCGDGLFAVEFARRNPDIFVVGLDIKLDRLYKAGTKALEMGVENCLFARMRADDLLRFLPERCLDQIWLTFSDPQPKKGNAKKRLTHLRYLKVYNVLLKDSGRVCFKSDSDLLYQFTLEQLALCSVQPLLNVVDTHKHLPEDSSYLIETVFEKKFLQQGVAIKAMEWGRCLT